MVPFFRRARAVAWPLVLSVALTISCSRKPERQPLGDAAPRAPKAQGSAAPAVAPPPPAISVQDVESQIVAWVAAQNRGDFGNYQSFYAHKFTGLKRSAERVVQFGRDGWMKDRKAMFEKPFTLEAKNISVHIAADMAVATFEQTWTSPTYQDRGTKRLVFLHEGKTLRISREEMLSSTATGAKPPLQISFAEAAIATKTLRSAALLLTEQVNANWTIDHPLYLTDTRAQRAVAEAALPAALREQKSRRYEVFDIQGHRCEVKPIGFQVMIHVIPHFGTIQAWQGHPWDGPPDGSPGRIAPPEERALALWQLSAVDGATAGRRLALELEPPVGCGAPVWGRVIHEGNPAPWTVDAPPSELARALENAVSTHPEVLKFDREARAEGSVTQGERWLVKIRSETSRLLRSEKGAAFMYAEAEGPGGCAYSTPSLIGLLFRQQGDKLVSVGRAFYPDTPLLGAVDLNGDGQPELITESGILTIGPQGGTLVVDHTPTSFDCSC